MTMNSLLLFFNLASFLELECWPALPYCDWGFDDSGFDGWDFDNLTIEVLTGYCAKTRN